MRAALGLISLLVVLAVVWSELAGDGLDVKALAMLGVDPIRHLVLPRIVALMLVMPVLNVIGFVVGKSAATLWAPFFPRHVLLETGDAVRGLALTLVVCALASVLAIRAALRVDPADAIGG